MSSKCLAAAAVFCVLAAPCALAQKTAPVEAAPAAGRALPPSWPRTLPVQGGQTDTRPALAWSPQEIALAQARCTAALKGLDIVAVPDLPIREGPDCGAAAPMKLLSVGKNPQVALSPPPTVTCDMIVALYRWLERDLQPLASKHLGAPVIRVEAMSSYSCRNAYGRSNSRLSEHGRANALDIAAFVTARGHSALVLADWGPTAREIEEQVAASKAATERAPATAAAGVTIGPGLRAAVPPQPAQPSPPAALNIRPSLSIAIPGIAIQVPGTQGDPPRALGLLPEPSRLGGPKPAQHAATPQPLPQPPLGKTEFLRGAHRTACKVFGTVLGPEANKAHRNHFHVDMAERKSSAICE